LRNWATTAFATCSASCGTRRSTRISATSKLRPVRPLYASSIKVAGVALRP
jgi:hypothetical protein